MSPSWIDFRPGSASFWTNFAARKNSEFCSGRAIKADWSRPENLPELWSEPEWLHSVKVSCCLQWPWTTNPSTAVIILSVVGKESPRSMFGTNIHPDWQSYSVNKVPCLVIEKQSGLDKLNTYHRSVNSHCNSRLTDRVGVFSQSKYFPGGSLRSTSKDWYPTSGWRIFRSARLNAALKLYPPLSPWKSQVLTNITEKLSTTCISQPKMTEWTMKSYASHAAHQQGMKDTVVTALAWW